MINLTNKNIIDKMRNSVALLSRGRIVYCNKAFTKLINQPKANLENVRFIDLLYNERNNNIADIKNALSPKVKKSVKILSQILSENLKSVIDVQIVISSLKLDDKNYKLLELCENTDQIEQLQIQRTINSLEMAVYSSRNLLEFFVQIHKIIDDEISAKNMYIAFYHKEDNTLTFPYFVDEKSQMPPRIKARKNLTEYTIKSGQVQLVDDETYNQLVKKKKVKLHGSRHAIWLGVPLKDGKDNLGALVVQDYKNLLAYSEKEKRFLAGIANTISDAIVRLRESRALEQSEKEYRAIFESAHDAIVVLDPKDEVILDANTKACEMYRVKKESFIGQSFKEFSKDFSYGRKGIEEAIEKGNIKAFNTIHLNSIGEEIYCEVNGAVIEFRNRKAIISIIRDVSERRKAEIEIKKHVTELENAKNNLEKNTKDLEKLNEKIRASEEKLIESNKQKDLLFSIIAHDLRSPFNSLLGFTQYLSQELDTLDREDIREFVQSIDKSSKNIFSLLENLLQWSKINTAGFNFAPTELQINEICDDVIHLYAANALKKKINMVKKVDQKLTINNDLNMLQTVLRNLLSNAIKFTDKNGSVELVVKNKSNGIEFSVKDTGVGISKAAQKQIFNLETRISTPGTDQESGIGLGLVLCYEFVQKMGGELKVESKRGVGTRFSFILQK